MLGELEVLKTPLTVTAVLVLMTGFSANDMVAAEDRPTPEGPVPVIFDTDMGNDIDDALALALLHALQSRGECELLAVTLTNETPHAAAFVDLVNTFYGRGEIPVGMVRGGATKRPSYTKQVAERSEAYSRSLDPKKAKRIPEATGVLRRVLAEQEDHSVVVVQVGFSTNLARLLESDGDESSALNGRELVARKVRLLSVMAGHFGKKRPSDDFVEFNIRRDVSSARQLFAQWPSRIVISGWEIGRSILYPAISIERDFPYAKHHPIRDAYRLWKDFPYDRPTWDLTSVLQAVRPERGYFGRSKPGTIVLNDKGQTSFQAGSSGQHRYLTVTPQQVVRLREAMTLLASQPPRAE